MQPEEGRAVADTPVGTGRVCVVVGDLTAQRVGAVVNAANERLQHGGGVAAALSRAGGPPVQSESDDWVDRHGAVQAGQAAVTTAGDMPAEHIVHVVGPRWRDGQDNEGLLRQAVGAALDAAEETGVSSVALPTISAGVFGYPPDEAGAVIADESRSWLASKAGRVREVRLVGFDDAAAEHFARSLTDM